MARSSRRPTYWTGVALNGTNIIEDTGTAVTLISAGNLEAAGEPTLIRIVGHLQLGSVPADTQSSHALNFWWGLRLAEPTAAALEPTANIGSEVWLRYGFLRSVYITESEVVWNGSNIVGTDIAHNQPGSWEYERFDGRAMRKVRDGEALVLEYNCTTLSGNPASVDLNGFVRVLLKGHQ